MILYHCIEAVRTVISKIPACLSYPVVGFTGELVYWLWPRGRRNMINTAANILHLDSNEPVVRKMSRQSMRNFAKYILDIVRYSKPKKDFFKNNFKVTGLDNLDTALRDGKGVILVGLHLGNLDLGVRWLGSMGYPVNALVNRLKSEGFNDFLQNPRSREGVKLIDAKNSSGTLVDILKQNEILALMIDCPNCRKGVRVKLGRGTAILPAGAATLALRTGATIVPCSLVRTSDTTFQGIIGKAIEYCPVGKRLEDIRQLTQQTVHSLEEIAKSYVGQWYVFHPLIKDNSEVPELV
jgi:phosphatidylinositol dimannoside acyltransferase